MQRTGLIAGGASDRGSGLRRPLLLGRTCQDLGRDVDVTGIEERKV